MEKILLEYAHNDTVAHITLRDGKGNVLDSVMMAELTACLDEFSQKTHLKLITFQGEGKHFSFGASVEEHTREKAPAMLVAFHGIFKKLMKLSIPTMARVSGQCLGGGMELALMCNLIFADETARFGQPEIVLGVFPPPASLLLPQKIGAARAEALLLTGATVTALEAQALGFVNDVFTHRETLFNQTEAWIHQHILPKSASSLRFAARAARHELNQALDTGLDQLEAIYLNELMSTHDANEGIQAFLEKRKPEWNHG